MSRADEFKRRFPDGFEFEGEGVLTPTSVDLQSASDSGSSNTDNITNAGSLSFPEKSTAETLYEYRQPSLTVSSHESSVV